MNSRFIYIDAKHNPLTEHDSTKKIYVLDKEYGEVLGFYHGGVFMGSDYDNANFFLPVLTDKQLAKFPGLRVKKYRLSKDEKSKREMLQPIYQQVGVYFGSGLFPAVKDVLELNRLVIYCLEKSNPRNIRKIGKYKITRR